MTIRSQLDQHLVPVEKLLKGDTELRSPDYGLITQDRGSPAVLTHHAILDLPPKSQSYAGIVTIIPGCERIRRIVSSSAESHASGPLAMWVVAGAGKLVQKSKNAFSVSPSTVASNLRESVWQLAIGQRQLAIGVTSQQPCNL